MKQKTIAYVANTRGYVEEALTSARSARQSNPEIDISILTYPDLYQEIDWVNWFELTGDYDAPIVKAEVISLPYEKILFIDGDTAVVGPLDTVFDTLDAFDLAAAHETTRGWDYKTPAAKAFSELNTGVMGIRKTPKTEAFFAAWKARFEKMRSEQGLKADQPSFRETLWFEQNIRLATLPSEYNFACAQPNHIAWDAVILHGRNDLEEVYADLQKEVGPRVYHPLLGTIGSISGRKKQLLAVLRLLWRSIRNVFGLPKERLRPFDWSK